MRPATFGFYGTQWRTWPGQEVVQAKHVEPAAPVMPPKSEVPGVDEESPVPGFELPAPEPEEAQEEPSGSVPTEPPSAEPAPLPTPEDRPKPGKPSAPSEDNLFDEAAVRRRSRERLAVVRQAAIQQERLRHEALRQQAQRLARAAVAAGKPATATPSATATLPVDRVVGAAPVPTIETRDAESRALQQAVHAEPEPRGLRDSVRKLLPGNPLR